MNSQEILRSKIITREEFPILPVRLDQVAQALYPEFSRSFLQHAIQDRRILVDNCPAKSGSWVKEGQKVTSRIQPPPDPIPQGENIPLEILYEDDDLLIINKPAGRVVHPAAGTHTGTIVNALLEKEGKDFLAKMTDENSTPDDLQRPGVVHRLDKDTSGVLVLARTKEAQQKLKEMFQNHQIQKTYLAIALGEVPLGKSPGEPLTVDLPIGRNAHNRTKMAIDRREGKEAKTDFYRLSLTPDQSATLLKIRLHTGRTHQIRVHLSHLNHPILGDTIYGGSPRKMPYPAQRQMLHAWRIQFTHPVTGKEITVTAPPPDDFMTAVRALRFPKPSK